MNLTKPELRDLLKAKRLALTVAERQAKSQAIADKLSEAIDWSQVNNLHCFDPIEALGEVDVLSVFDGKHKNHIKINNLYMDKKVDNGWQTVAFEGDSTIPVQYDVIIVPMLGFDSNLHRIGYGGGYYDKFLSTQPHAVKIGVCFEAGHVDKLPLEPHDIPLNLIITEDKVYHS